MESFKALDLVNDQEIKLDIRKGVFWFVAVDINSIDDIFKLMTLSNGSDVDCEIYGCSLTESEDIKTWTSHQELKIKILLLNDQMKDSLKIDSIPFYTCTQNGKLVYSSKDFPLTLEFLKQTEDELKELSSFKPAKNEANKDTEKKLENALKEIKTLKNQLKEQTKVIEDCQAEMKELKGLLSQKSNEKKSGNQVKMENLSWNKAKNYKPRFDELDFWKIEDGDNGDDFEDLPLPKDLWLMGLLHDSSKKTENFQSRVSLPPLFNSRNKDSKANLRENPIFRNKNGPKSSLFSQKKTSGKLNKK